MKLSVAYGIPASGKTTLLKTLPGIYFDYDTPDKRKNAKTFIENLPEGEYVVDFLLKNPNDFVNFFFSKFPNANLTIYKFLPNREMSELRDLKRREKSSITLIRTMDLEEINNHTNLTVEVIK
jgi:hypothetical protein